MGHVGTIETPDAKITESGPTPEQTADTPGHDENGDGVPGGQTTADVPGDVLGI